MCGEVKASGHLEWVCPSGLRLATSVLADGRKNTLHQLITPRAREVSDEMRGFRETGFRVAAPAGGGTLVRMSEVTRLLDAVAAGDRQAAADLLPLVYDE